MESKKKVKKSRLIYISIVVVLLLLQVVAWNSRSFSDAYIAYIFPSGSISVAGSREASRFLWENG